MKLALGTVQFGLNYGVTNGKGQVTESEVERILHTAYQAGCQILDTAYLYGESEAVLGRSQIAKSFKVFTKLPEIRNNSHYVETYVKRSLTNLQRDSVEGVMLHRESDLIGDNADIIFDNLCKLKESKIINKLGCSFYEPDVLVKVLERYDLDIIQVPMNPLDQRFIKAIEIAKEKNVEVHVRSLFLQGILLGSPENIIFNEADSKELAEYYHTQKSSGLSKLEFTLNFLKQNSSIDYGVIGCTSQIEIAEICSTYQKVMSMSAEKANYSNLASKSKTLINPSLWNSK